MIRRALYLLAVLVAIGCLAQLVAYEDAHAAKRHRHCHRAGIVEVCPSPKIEIGTAETKTVAVSEWNQDLLESDLSPAEIADAEPIPASEAEEVETILSEVLPTETSESPRCTTALLAEEASCWES